jgi:hypothetical protein
MDIPMYIQNRSPEVIPYYVPPAYRWLIYFNRSCPDYIGATLDLVDSCRLLLIIQNHQGYGYFRGRVLPFVMSKIPIKSGK